MEGLKKRAFIFAGIMLVAGAFNLATSARAERPDRTESWMEQRVPEKIGDMTFLKSDSNPAQSYKMDEVTYRVLAPFGIVARVYTGNSGEGYDVVVIASESRASFHDPRICFSASGWTISEQHQTEVQTKTRGTVPITVVRMEGRNNKGQLAAYFYRGPSGFNASTVSVKLDMFWKRLFGSKDIEGVFYRIIPVNEHITEEQMKKFIGEYLEASKASSDGYF